MTKVFICHSSEDRLLLDREVIPLLQRHGLATWFSNDNIQTADEWERSIRKGLTDCEWFLVALSPRAIASSWVRTEVHWAADFRWGRIVPVLLEPCDPSELHLKLAQLQFVDFTAVSDRTRARLLAPWGIPYQALPQAPMSEPQRRRDQAVSLPGYSLIQTIGRGGSATVFLMQSAQRQERVAVKLFDADLDSEFIAATLDAIRRWRPLRHAAIVSIYDVGEIGGSLYVVMEYVEGPTLAAAMKIGSSARQSAQWIAEISDGLAIAHGAGALHRDLKPSNILIDRAHHARIADFGILPPRPGYVLGTPAYVSPEGLLGRPTDARSDIWGLGVMLYELLSGRRPFASGSLSAHIDQVLRADPPRLSSINAEVPAELERICLRCLSKNPDDRFSTAAELARDLRAWLALPS